MKIFNKLNLSYEVNSEFLFLLLKFRLNIMEKLSTQVKFIRK